MINNEETIILNNQLIEKKFNQYKIKLTYNFNNLTFQIQKIDSYFIFESTFNLDYLHQYNLLISSMTIIDIIKLIIDLIDKNNIEIIENQSNLKFILISILPNHPNVKLIIKKKNIMINEQIKEPINEIKYIKDENEKLNKRLKLLENEIIQIKLNKNYTKKINKIH
jgi:hypothetical protein